jgi:hypothetical protein
MKSAGRKFCDLRHYRLAVVGGIPCSCIDPLVTPASKNSKGRSSFPESDRKQIQNPFSMVPIGHCQDGSVQPQGTNQGDPHNRDQCRWRRPLVIQTLKLLHSPDGEGKTYAEFSRQTGIPASTNRDWHRRLQIHQNWTPWSTKHGEHLRIFTVIEELALANFIKTQVISSGHIFQDPDFRFCAIAKSSRS